MPIPNPVTQELAPRDDMLGASRSAAASREAFAAILQPDDGVLLQKGGDYRLYRETLRDDQCASTWGDRQRALLAAEWKVEPGGKRAIDKAAADFLTEQLQSLEFDRITEGMHYARWYGHAVGECLWAQDGRYITLKDIRVRDRGRFGYDDRMGLFLLKDGRYQPMPERKFWTVSAGADNDDSPYGLGLGHYCYWPVFFKRNGLKFWLVFLEKFGMPTATGKAPAGRLDDDNFKAKALAALRAIASETAVLVPEGLEVEFLEAARSGAGTYDTMHDAMNAALAKLIVGQTASSQGTPGRLGNDKLQGDVRSDLVKADADLLCGSFNRQVAAWLTEWNFPGAKVPKVWRVTEPPEDMNTRAERDSKVYALGYEPTPEYIEETYGPGWQKKAAQAGLDPNAVPAQLAAEFAELGAIAAMKTGHRADQAALVEAAQAFANSYQDVMGARVQQLLDYAEETQDYATMAKRLREMMAEAPPQEPQQALLNGGVFARLLARFRAQR